MSIESRRAAAKLFLNSRSGFGAHQISRDTFQERAPIFNFDAIRMIHKAAGKARQFVLKMTDRRKVMVGLNKQQTDHSRNVINIDLAVGDVLRVIKIDHIDGPVFRFERRSYDLSGAKWSRS